MAISESITFSFENEEQQRNFHKRLSDGISTYDEWKSKMDADQFCRMMAALQIIAYSDTYDAGELRAIALDCIRAHA